MIPVEKQLAITVYRFGCDGSAASYWKIGQHFGVSDGGTIRNCTDRVIQVRPYERILGRVINYP